MSRLWFDLLSERRIESGTVMVYFGTLIDSTEPFTRVNDLVFTDTIESARAYGPHVLACHVRIDQPRVIEEWLPDRRIRDSLAAQGQDEIDEVDGLIILTGNSVLYRPVSADQVTILSRIDP